MKRPIVTSTLTLPRKFVEDHEARGLPTPKVLRWCKASVVVNADDSAVADLLADAEFYADAAGPDQAGALKRSAVALLKALRQR